MKVRILSDLHGEHGQPNIVPIACDVLVVAGDLHTKQNGLPWLREFAGETPVVYVCGNHEFYGDKFPRVIERLREATEGTNIHVLEDRPVVIGGWLFYGCSLWTDMELHGDWQTGCHVAQAGMNDYKRIRNSRRGYRKLRAEDTRFKHQQSRRQLEGFLRSSDLAKIVVVTHHAPSAMSLPSGFASDPLAVAYASDLEPLIKENPPRLWIHGHIHSSSDYEIGSTRVICNPHGYLSEPNPEFDPGLVIEL